MRGLAATLGNMSMASRSPAPASGRRPSVRCRGCIRLAWLRHCGLRSTPRRLSVVVSLLVARRRSLCRHPGSDHATVAYPANHAACAADRLTAPVRAAIEPGSRRWPALPNAPLNGVVTAVARGWLTTILLAAARRAQPLNTAPARHHLRCLRNSGGQPTR